MSNMFRRHLLASTLLVGATVAAPAFAQSGSTPPNAAGPAEANAVGASATGTQDAAAAPAAQAGDTGAIIVTGSLIKNPNLKSAAPVQVVGRDEISLRQSNTAEELLRTLPGVTPSIGSAVNNGNGGASELNLRNLGEQRNLVLLDGQRITPADITGVVDLNNIPLALIERVDVLTGGAATTYGADAVSGVVNFVTRTDFSGIEMNSSEQINQQGDGNTFRTDITIGGNFDEGKGNAVLSVGYQKSDPVTQGDRSYSAVQLESFTGGASGSNTTVPGRFTRPGQPVQQINPTTGALVPTFQKFNFNPYNLFQTPFKRFNIFGEAHYDASDHVTFYTRGMFSKNTVDTVLAPGGAFGVPIAINYNNPYLPLAAATQFAQANGLINADGTDNGFAAARAATGPTDPNYKTFTTTATRRTPELGNRAATNTTTLFDYKAGVKFNIFDSLSLDVGGNYGQSENNAVTTGNLRASRLANAALASSTTTCDGTDTSCVPVNLFGPNGSITAAQAAYLAGPTEVTEKTSLVQAHALLTGDFGVSSPLASNPISFAVGGEYRKYTASQVSDVLSQTPGEISGSGGAAPNIHGAYEVTEGYGELSVPLVNDKPFAHSLSAEGGVRYSHYKIDTAGSPTFNTTTYKGAGTWEPVQGVTLRGNYQHAVRAPSIAELFSPVVTSLTNLGADPCATLTSAGATIPGATAPTGALRDVCIAQGATAATVNLIQFDPQINSTGGGNINLKPEKSNSFTAGVVLTPAMYVPGLSFTVDYFKIKITDAITSPTPGDAIAACFNGASTTNGGAGLPAGAATSAACTGIRRDPVTGALFGDSATVPGIPLTLSNLGTLKTDGIDVTANYRHDFGLAKLNLSFNGTWTNTNKFQATPGGLNRECVGYFSVNCASPQPEFVWDTRATVTVKQVDFSVLWRHLSKLKQEPADIAIDGPAFTGTDGLGDNVNFGKIKAFNYFDLSMRTIVGDHLELTFTVANLANKKPPIVGTDIGSTLYNSGNTYPSLYDAEGRRFLVGAQVKF